MTSVKLNRFSPLVERISGEGAEAWALHHEAQRACDKGEDAIVLSVGDPNFDTPALIIEAAVDALRSGDTHYADIPGRPEIRQAIADYANKLAGEPAYAPENTILMAGAQCALFTAIQCLLDKDDEVLAVDPVYVTYEAAIGVNGAKLTRVPADEASGYRPDFDLIENSIKPETKVLLLTSPNNPTGVALNEIEAKQLEDLVKKHDLWLMVDEVYAELMFEKPFVSCLSLRSIRNQTVIVGSLSKSHAMTGWRAGWAIGPADLVEHMEKMALCMLFGSPGFVQAGALVALTTDLEEPHTMRQAYRRRAQMVFEKLSAAKGLKVIKPDAGMFCLVDVSELKMSGLEFAQALYTKTGVSVLAGKPFGENLASCVRLSFSIGDAALTTALDRICDFTKEL